MLAVSYRIDIIINRINKEVGLTYELVKEIGEEGFESKWQVLSFSLQ